MVSTLVVSFLMIFYRFKVKDKYYRFSGVWTWKEMKRPTLRGAGSGLERRRKRGKRNTKRFVHERANWTACFIGIPSQLYTLENT